ncbi:MAG: flavin reductase family protein [Spirochaetales bacterium]
MEIRPDDRSAREMYKLMIGTIVPRPIAWVTTCDQSGTVNLAPFSFFNGVCSSPPTVSLSFSWTPDTSDHAKDTLHNIRATRELVINIVSEPHAVAMNATSARLPRGESELSEAGLDPTSPQTGSTPRIAGAPVCFECAFDREVAVGAGPGSATLVLATVRHVHVDDALIDENLYIDVERLAPVGRLAGNQYCRLGEIFSLDRPIR